VIDNKSLAFEAKLLAKKVVNSKLYSKKRFQIAEVRS